jgi:hypothetical protein
MYSFANFFDHIFLENRGKKNVKKRNPQTSIPLPNPHSLLAPRPLRRSDAPSNQAAPAFPLRSILAASCELVTGEAARLDVRSKDMV